MGDKIRVPVRRGEQTRKAPGLSWATPGVSNSTTPTLDAALRQSEKILQATRNDLASSAILPVLFVYSH